MTDEHAKLTAEYETLLRHAEKAKSDPALFTAGAGLGLCIEAVVHILKRLGPPTAEEAADIGIAEDEA